MNKTINNVDIVFGASWGDEGKGKITHFLASKTDFNGQPYYDFVARWNGGSNAGHTIYHKGKKFATHIVPSGVFYDITSVIGPNCVVNLDSFYKEINQLSYGGIDTSLIKIHPNAHIVTDEHIAEDKAKLAGKLGTTSQGIAPAYRDKYARTGLLAKDSTIDKSFLLREDLHGNILCEGAQGFHLDINYGNYPYVTSSECLPYAACSLGFAPQKIKNIYACSKLYDTRSGEDPLFPSSLLEDPILSEIGEIGKEYGVTTGRRRKVNWLNLDKLIEALCVSGATELVVNKCDIIKQVGVYKLFHYDEVIEFTTITEMQHYISHSCYNACDTLRKIYYSGNPETIEGFKAA
jgi:adenylosuccinate synthase